MASEALKGHSSEQLREKPRKVLLSPAQHRKVKEPPLATSQAVSAVSSHAVRYWTLEENKTSNLVGGFDDHGKDMKRMSLIPFTVLGMGQNNG